MPERNMLPFSVKNRPDVFRILSGPFFENITVFFHYISR